MFTHSRQRASNSLVMIKRMCGHFTCEKVSGQLGVQLCWRSYQGKQRPSSGVLQEHHRTQILAVARTCLGSTINIWQLESFLKFLLLPDLIYNRIRYDYRATLPKYLEMLINRRVLGEEFGNIISEEKFISTENEYLKCFQWVNKFCSNSKETDEFIESHKHFRVNSVAFWFICFVYAS